MKIKTITCHDCYNLGASLQAFSLQHYLESQGHEVEIIHYKPDYLSNHYKFSAVNNPIFDKPLIKQLYLLAKLPGRLLSLTRKRAFDKFTSTYLHLTRRYNSYEELKADPPVADAYIAGSDQIWNTIFPNGRDAAFYLHFGNSEVKRISYAASFATQEIVPPYRDFVSRELKNLDNVSIREKISLPLLYSLGRKDGVAVCDPVFLIDRMEWNTLVHSSDYVRPKDKFILVYVTAVSSNIEKISLGLKAKTGWKIYVISPLKVHFADVDYSNCGPLDFVGLVRDAEFVVSNSFHATAFSLIMEKNFCVVNRDEDINERMKSVLLDVALSHRLVSVYNDELLSPILYDDVRKKLQSIIVKSKEWLIESCQ